MSKKMTVPESCEGCRYNPTGELCMKHSCKDCPMGSSSFCKCLTIPKGSVCPYAEYINEDTCIICGEKYSFSEDGWGARLNGFSVTLSLWDNTGNKKERWARNRMICPECGEQLKKCMEETSK